MLILLLIWLNASSSPHFINLISAQVLCIKRRVIAVGWSHDICVFRDKQLMSSDFNIMPDEWSGRREHTEDIMCAVYHAPGSFRSYMCLKKLRHSQNNLSFYH